MRKLLAILAVGGMFALGAPGVANAAKKKGDGLVNVVVGDDVVDADVTIVDAADIVVGLCGINTNVAVALASLVDQTNKSKTICWLENGDEVKITQND